MDSIVVGQRQVNGSGGLLRFAEAEAARRNQPIEIVHVWNASVEVSVDLLDYLDTGVVVTASAVAGPVATALMCRRPGLLVLGHDSASSHHLSSTIRACLHQLRCPVVIVPPSNDGRVRRIVVGVSDSAASVAALHWAIGEADLCGAELVVVRAWQVSPHTWRDVFQLAHLVGTQQRPSELALQHWVSASSPGTDATVIAQHGGPLDILLEASETADLLVLGHSQHGALGHSFRGHFADDLITLARCPIAVIPVSPECVSRR